MNEYFWKKTVKSTYQISYSLKRCCSKMSYSMQRYYFKVWITVVNCLYTVISSTPICNDVFITNTYCQIIVKNTLKPKNSWVTKGQSLSIKCKFGMLLFVKLLNEVTLFVNPQLHIHHLWLVWLVFIYYT